jgi:hypothetical protein
MKLPGSGQQIVTASLYDASGSITTGGTPQLVLAQSPSRSYLYLQNTSSGSLYFEFGSARATATISNGTVSSISVANAGFGFTYPPLIELFGGGNAGNTSYLGLGQPNAIAPSGLARAHCVMTGTAPNLSVSSIVVDDGGSGYVTAPYVFLYNDPKDPNGCAAPSSTSGILIKTGNSFSMENTMVTTDAVSVFGATTGLAFVCKWSD